MREMRWAMAVVAANAAAWAAGPAYATNGMLPHCTGAISCGMGGVALALPTEAANAAMNPAALGRLGSEISASVGWFHPARTMDSRYNAGGGPVHIPKQTSQVEDYPEGSLAGNYRLSPQWAVGAVLFSAGGGETKYQTGRLEGAVNGYDSQVRIRMANLASTVAWTPTPTQSYGFSVVLGYQDFKSNMATGTFAQTAGANELERVWGHGFRFGVMWDLSDEVRVGATVSNGVKYNRLTKYRDLFLGAIDIPAEAGFGVAVRATPNTDVALDMKVVQWSEVRAIGTAPQSGGFGWRDQPVIALGVQHRLSDAFTVRAGWNYGRSPIADENTFANALFPAIVEHHITAGATWHAGPQWDLSLAGFYAPEVTQRETGGGDSYSRMGAGSEISMYQYGAQIGIRRSF